MSIDLAATPLVEVVRDLHFDRFDGVLAVVAGPRLELFFDRGDLFYARSDDPEQRLESLLVRWGLVAPHAVPALVARAGRDVRGTLVREGVFPSAQAFDEFMAQILRERAMDAFSFRTGTCTTEPKDVRAMRQLAFPSTTANVVLEGARRMSDADERLAPLVNDDASLILNERPAIRIESLQMGPTEGYLMSLVTGRTPLGEILRVSPAGRSEALRLLYALLVLDVLRHPAFVGSRFTLSFLVQRSAYDRQKEQSERERIDVEYQRVRSVDLFQMIPGGSTMAPDALREAVKAYQETWSADKFTPRIAKEMRDQLLLVSGRASELLLAAMDAERRRHQAEHEPVEAAEGMSEDQVRFKRMELSKSSSQEKQERDAHQAADYHRRAIDSFRAKDYHHAVEFAREAIRLDEKGAYHATLGDALSMNPLWGKRAEESYLRAIELDTYSTEFPYALGRLYARSNLKQRARDMFEKVLSLSPDHAGARDALKDLGR